MFVQKQRKCFPSFMLLVVSVYLSKQAAPPTPHMYLHCTSAELVYSVPWCCTLQSRKIEKQKGRHLPCPLRFHYSMETWDKVELDQNPSFVKAV